MGVVYDWVADDQVNFFTDFLPQELRLAYEKQPQFMIYGIVEERVAVGAALVQVAEPEAVLHYIYIAPDYRGRGLCGECLAHLGYALWRAGIYWLTARYIPKEHETLHRWLTFHGAWTNPSGCGDFRFQLQDVKDNKSLAGSAEGITPLSACEAPELALLGKRMRQKGFVPVRLPIDPADYDADCSCVYKKDGRIEALLLVRREGDALELPFVYSDADSPAVFLMLARFILQEGMKRYPADTVVTLHCVEEPMAKLLEKLLERPMEDETYLVTFPLTAYDEYHRQFLELLLEEPMDLSDLAEAAEV